MLASPLIWTMLGYLLGSVPFGLLLTRAFGAGDLRQVGSGNIGATNVLRTGRRGLALTTLLLDGGKGAGAVLLARQVTGDDTLAAIAGLAAFVGHLFPVWLRFRGGKGVATMLGVTLAAAWPVGIAALLVWAAGAAATRFSSVGGMLAALVGPTAFAFGLAIPPWVAVAVAMAVLVVVRHRDNIARLRAGTESRIGAR